MPLIPWIHITAAYSNAVLVAILPHVSDTAKTLNLPIMQPISLEQVDHFNTSPNPDDIGGGLWLTNGYWFAFSHGRIDFFHSPNDWFSNPDFDGVEQIVGPDNITTNAAIDLARTAFSSLGFNQTTFLVDKSPTTLEGPYDSKQFAHIPFCRGGWEFFNKDSLENWSNSYSIKFDVDMQHKQIVGMAIILGAHYWKPSPQIEVPTESERDYRKRIHGMNTNAPATLN